MEPKRDVQNVAKSLIFGIRVFPLQSCYWTAINTQLNVYKRNDKISHGSSRIAKTLNEERT